MLCVQLIQCSLSLATIHSYRGTMQLNDHQLNEIRSAAATSKLQAIKIYKELTGASLSESKQFVESLDNAKQSDGTNDSGLSDEVMDKVLDELSAGKKVAAIRLYRNHTGKTLIESRAFIEDLAEKLGLDLPAGVGCASAVFILFVVSYHVLARALEYRL